MKCDVCEGEKTDGGVRAVPGIPVSVFYCVDCLEGGRTHPWWALIATTALVGGLEHAAPWWCQTVEEQVPLLGRTMEEFEAEVQAELAAEQERNRALPPDGIITTPFTDEQVGRLNVWQVSGLHPFTCGWRDDHVTEGILIATHEGWICPEERCSYTQDWAHDFMATPRTEERDESAEEG
jgi:hypothetical protein